MAVFGNTNLQTGNAQIDYGSDHDVEEYIGGAQFTAPASGTVTSITVYLSFIAGSRQAPDFYVKCAIYERDSVSNTHDLIGVTEQRTFTWVPLTAVAGWYTFNIVSGGAIVNGTDYILAAWGEVVAGTGATSGVYIKYNIAGPSDYYYVATPYTGIYPDPWTASDLADFYVSIYATYTPSGGVPVGSLALMGVGI